MASTPLGVFALLLHTSIPLRSATNTLNDWNIHLVRTQKSMLHKCPGRSCFYNRSMLCMLFGSSSEDFHWQTPTSRAETQSLPVVFAVLQERMSVSARSVCAHVCIPACHGTSRDVVLHTCRGERGYKAKSLWNESAQELVHDRKLFHSF